MAEHTGSTRGMCLTWVLRERGSPAPERGGAYGHDCGPDLRSSQRGFATPKNSTSSARAGALASPEFFGHWLDSATLRREMKNSADNLKNFSTFFGSRNCAYFNSCRMNERSTETSVGYWTQKCSHHVTSRVSEIVESRNLESKNQLGNLSKKAASTGPRWIPGRNLWKKS